jgi:hypothetical protein
MPAQPQSSLKRGPTLFGLIDRRDDVIQLHEVSSTKVPNSG